MQQRATGRPNPGHCSLAVQHVVTCKPTELKLFSVFFSVPVQNVYIEQSGESIICRSEGISPEPTLTWSTDPESSSFIEPKPRVQQNGQLYSISSSLTRSEIDAGLNYICTVSTRKSRRTATLFKLSEYLRKSRSNYTHLFVYLSYFLELFIRITVNDQIFLETGINFFLCHMYFSLISFQLMSLVLSLKQQSSALTQKVL